MLSTYCEPETVLSAVWPSFSKAQRQTLDEKEKLRSKGPDGEKPPRAAWGHTGPGGEGTEAWVHGDEGPGE